MMYVLFGDNTYARDQALTKILDGREAERVDGEQLELRDLPSLLLGQTLFASQRVIVVRNLSDNTTVWSALEQYLAKIPDETTVLLVEAKPDKRTKTYKSLQQRATVREFALPRTTRDAEQFVLAEAKQRGVKMGASEARSLVARGGTDPWQLVHALEKLAVLDVVDDAVIEEIVEQSHEAQVFGLFEKALAGESAQVHEQIAVLETRENPHQTLGFLTSQAMQLAALVAGKGHDVAHDMGAHPFALGKLEPYARKMSWSEVQQVLSALADCDMALKRSHGEPWQRIEIALMQISNR